MFADGSRPCKDLFQNAPASIVSTRPETDMRFLQFLRGKEHLLHRLAVRDLEQRTELVTDTQRAVTNLGDSKQRIFREILGDISNR